MILKVPITYVRQRRDIAQARKPTAHAKLQSLPFINPQVSSTFFNEIPGEIRQLIYEYALLEYPDLSRKYNQHSYYYRPGYTHARCINTNLLLTCRRVYLEAGQLAVEQNEHLIYQPVDHGPPRHRPYLLPQSKAAKKSGPRRGLMKLEQRQSVKQVHIFAQQCWLEGWNMQWGKYCRSWSKSQSVSKVRDAYGNGCDHPPRLKITIRHTDWWYYLLGRSSPLALDAKRLGRAWPGVWIPKEAGFDQGSWGSQIEKLQGLKVFELELETLWGKRGELQAVVENAKDWRFTLADGNVLVCDPSRTTSMIWTGSKHVTSCTTSAASDTTLAEQNRNAPNGPVGTRINGDFCGLFNGDCSNLAFEDRLEYIVTSMTWQAETASEDNDSGKSDGHRDVGESAETDAESELNADDASAEVDHGTTNTHANAAAAAPAPGLAQPIAPQQGIFAHNIARAPRRDAFPTYYG